MKASSIKRIPQSIFVGVILFIFAALAYGLLIPWLGFYWDEFPMLWIARQLGNEGLARYFATNRPIWGMVYQLTTPVLGIQPWGWQLFGLLWRWLSAFAFWGVCTLTWRDQKRAALAGALVFLLYPGFVQQSIAMMYGHFFIVLSIFLLSLCCTLYALRSPKRSWIFHALGAVLACLNLLMMEYFFLLELIRPVLIFVALEGKENDLRGRLFKAMRIALLYLVVFCGVVIWRIFFFGYQTTNYRPLLLDQLRDQPLAALGNLILKILGDLGMVLGQVWVNVLSRAVGEPGGRGLLLYGSLSLLGVVLVLVVFLFVIKSPARAEKTGRSWLGWVLVGLWGCWLAGWPFWLTGLPIGLDFPNDRFTLPFLLGISLISGGLFALLDRRPVWSVVVLAVLIGGSLGAHSLNAGQFRRDWNQMRTFFWQLNWRAPQLASGTTLVTNDMPFDYYSDNSLTAPLNWIYAPQNHTDKMSFMLYYASIRSTRALNLTPHQEINQNYLAATFHGSTDRLLALTFQPPACLRVIESAIETENPMLPGLLRQVSGLSDEAVILPSAGAADLPPALFGSEPAHGWCYFFEKADLARQREDWQEVARLGEEAFALSDYPNDPAERLVFIEGYAQVGDWQRSLALSRETGGITPLMRIPLCRLWQRIEQTTSPSSQRTEVLGRVDQDLRCQSIE